MAIATVAFTLDAGVVTVGSGSYSDQFPGTDKAGRNKYITVDPALSGAAAAKPVPTNDWWCNELINSHGENMFNYPMALRPQDNGLVMIKNMQGQAVLQGLDPLRIGLQGLSCARTTVSDFSDWTVTLSWGDMEATVGTAMPFAYFTRKSSAPVSISAMGSLTADGNVLIVSGSYNGAAYAVYAPEGSSWNVSGSSATSDLAGKDYFSAVLLPDGADPRSAATAWKKYAFVFPADTRAEFVYNHDTGEVVTTYSVTPDVKEGTASDFLFGMLPHHWGHLKGSYTMESGEYSTVRGKMKMYGGKEFRTSLTFHGVLPTMPAVQDASTGFSQEELNRLIDAVNTDNGISDWTDSYNDGQILNRLVQTARVAKESGNETAFRTAFDMVKERVENWLSYTPGEVAFLFYYHKPWSTLLGYPAGHGQDENINDHHFHWGYIIHAAAFLEQYEPGWGASSKWGGMINLLVRDAASSDRNDTMFPYLRNFSPYAGHCWANGTALLGQGIDQESTSESMQFNCSLIHWGEITGNQAIRDLGVYLYVTELSAIEEYWFDVNHRIFSSDYTSAVASRVFSNAYDNQNFWGGGIAGSYGIQIYPVHAGSFYLVNNKEFATKYWNAMKSETGIMNNENNPNIWYDTWCRFYSMIDPQGALDFYNKCTHLGEKFGESQAHTYQWIHAMAKLGTPDLTVTANHPLACVFLKDGVRTYAAQNYGTEPLEVKFSDGYTMQVPARTLASSTSSEPLPQVPTAVITIDNENCKPGDKVMFTAEVDGGDYQLTGVIIKIDGESLETSVIARAAGTYCAEWAAVEGSHSVVAEMSAADRTFLSVPFEFTVKKDGGDTPVPGPGDESVVVKDFEATDHSQGTFAGPYKIKFTPAGSGVRVSAKFEGEYVGFAGPWLWNQTDGFQEVEMSSSGEDGEGWYAYFIPDLKPGATIKVAVKIAFAGGLGVSPTVEYTLPLVNAVTEVTDGSDRFVIFPNPARTELNVLVPSVGELSIWSMGGNRVASYAIDTVTTLDVSFLPAGVYLVTYRQTDGTRMVRKLIKK